MKRSRSRVKPPESVFRGWRCAAINSTRGTTSESPDAQTPTSSGGTPFSAQAAGWTPRQSRWANQQRKNRRSNASGTVTNTWLGGHGSYVQHISTGGGARRGAAVGRTLIEHRSHPSDQFPNRRVRSSTSAITGSVNPPSRLHETQGPPSGLLGSRCERSGVPQLVPPPSSVAQPRGVGRSPAVGGWPSRPSI